MSSNTNVYGDISPRTAAYAAIRLLTRGQFDLVTERFGQSRPLPKKKSKTIKFRRYESLPRATAPLAEGVPPEGRKLTYTDVSCSLEQYGDIVELTDVIADTHEDNVFKETFDNCGEQAAETIEVVRIAFLKAGSNIYYANNAGARASVNSPPLRSDFRRIYRGFRRNKAATIGNIIKASAKISTEPVDPAYFVMGHTDCDADVRNMDGFIPVKEYSNSDRALPAEVGSVDQFRLCLTALFEPWETSGYSGTTYLSSGDIPSSSAQADVYPLIAVGKNGYAIVPFQGKNAVVPMVVNPNGRPSVGNELAQKGFVSWKTYQTGTILNQLWVARLEAAATAVPD
jgi:N4-gp56 family major capsid protein